MEAKKYRTPEEMVADLEAKIASIKLRAERKAARKDPVVKEVVIAVKAVDRALAAGPVEPMKGGLVEARQTLAQVVATTGVMLAPPVVEPTKREKRTRKSA